MLIKKKNLTHCKCSYYTCISLKNPVCFRLCYRYTASFWVVLTGICKCSLSTCTSWYYDCLHLEHEWPPWELMPSPWPCLHHVFSNHWAAHGPTKNLHDEMKDHVLFGCLPLCFKRIALCRTAVTGGRGEIEERGWTVRGRGPAGRRGRRRSHNHHHYLCVQKSITERTQQR